MRKSMNNFPIPLNLYVMFCTHLRKFNIAECGVYLKKAEEQAER